MSRAAAVLALVGAAIIHNSVVEVHLRQSPERGAFFVVLAIAETFLAVAMLTPPSPRLLRAAIAASLATAGVWAASRTVGVPVGPDAWVPEPVGRADGIATLLELTTAAVLLPLALPNPGTRISRAVVGATALAIAAGTLAAVRDGHHHDGIAHANGHGARPYVLPPAERGEGRYFVAMAPAGAMDVQIGVGPAAPGVNTIDLLVQDSRGARVALDGVDVRAWIAGRQRQALRFRATPLAPGHFIVDTARLPSPGWWRLRVEADAGALGRLRRTVTVPVDR